MVVGPPCGERSWTWTPPQYQYIIMQRNPRRSQSLLLLTLYNLPLPPLKLNKSSRKMATPSSLLFLLLISTFAYFIVSPASAAATPGPSSSSSAAANFIKASCSTTRYPALCVQSLAAYANTVKLSHKELAEAALAVSLARAQAAREFVTRSAKLKGLKAREYEAVKDCLEEMGDSVDRLGKSMKELKGMGSRSKGQDFVWHVSNVETWVSAALTDENTCMDSFSEKATEGRLKTSIRARVVDMAQVTSNALALVNRFASKH